MAETEEIHPEPLQSSFPSGRVKRIIKLDTEINKINSDALFLISNASEMFLRFVAEKSSKVAIQKKRKTIKVEDIRVAVKQHRPTADFLLDSLPAPIMKTNEPRKSSEKKKKESGSVPAGTRGIDSFFKKCPLE